MSKGRVYISGPMTGEPELNYPAFRQAEKWLKGMGYDVITPLELDTEHDPGDAPESWWFYVKRDLDAIWNEKPDYIYLLDGWSKSYGAAMELLIMRKMNKKRLVFIDGKMLVE